MNIELPEHMTFHTRIALIHEDTAKYCGYLQSTAQHLVVIRDADEEPE